MSRTTLVAALLVLAADAARAQTPAPTPDAPPPAAAASAAARPDSLALGRKFTAWLYTSEIDSLIAASREEDRARPELRASIERAIATIATRAGTEIEVVEEKFVRRNGSPQYWRTARFTNFPEPVLVRLVIVDGQLRGFGLGPLSQAPPVDP